MRRVLGACVIALAMLPAVVAGATEGGTTQETYKDYFDSVSYSGNNGSLEWSGPWVEEGENDGPNKGSIRVVSSGCSGKCLEIRGGLLSELRVRRAADLSGFLDATIHFSVEIDEFLASTGVLYVEVKDGSDWPILAEYPLLLTSDGNYSVPIPSDHLEEGFEFRFCLGQLIGGDVVYIDDVKIIGSVLAPTTTTSTTSTTSPSTTSTTAPAVTTTTKPKGTTSSTSPQTSTTKPADTDVGSVSTEPSTTTTTTTTAPATSESASGDDNGVVVGAGNAPPIQPETIDSGTTGVPEGSGLRQSRVGLLADYRPGKVGGMSADDIEVLGVSLDADFSLAAEAFEATRLWIAGLALLIAIVLVSGMDVRWTRRFAPGLARDDLSGSARDHGGSETEE